MLALVLRLLLDPWLASHAGAAIAGAPELGRALARIAARESAGRLVGVHPADAWLGPLAWRNAARVGLIDPQCQARGDGRRWATRGVHGMVAAYSVAHLWTCAPPHALDVPLLSAIAATRRMRSRSCALHRRCRSWRSA